MNSTNPELQNWPVGIFKPIKFIGMNSRFAKIHKKAQEQKWLIVIGLVANNTLVKSSRIYTGQYTFPILLLNDDNMLGEHKLREKNIVYGRLF